ncbi:MAG: bifunctional DNA-formamidopyrimidine glycosylase/DNA-(apurinic or apyrimidinic site) lyase [Pseudomonadota bacterium]
MPELPEVETVRRGLAPVLEGAKIERLSLRRADLRFPFPEKFSEKLKNQRVTAVGRRAKYLLVHLESSDVLIMHLGMSGSFRIELPEGNRIPGVFHHPRSEAKAHDHVVFHLRQGKSEAEVIYNDPRRFGYMDMVNISQLETCRHFAKMGIEPTGNALSGDILAPMFRDKRTSLKAALLDQRLIAGLGNIYVCEALWRSGLSPKRQAGTLVKNNGAPTDRLALLAVHVRDVIAEAIESGGSSLRDHRQTNGDLGYFQHRFSAYDQEGNPCSKETCNGTICRIVQSGRSSFYCPKCQR